MGVFTYFEKLITEHGSSAILRERIVLLEQQHHAEKQKLKAELDALAEQYRMVTSERDYARSELQLTKSELEKAKIRISQMEPLAIKAREMAIAVTFRKAIFGSGYVLGIQNKTTKPLALNVTVTDATRQRNMHFRVVANGGSAQGANFTAAPAKEIGHREGWAFVSGDTVDVGCADYDSIQMTVP
jgi:hypothetical protein